MLTPEQVEQFIDGYIECALWADCNPPEPQCVVCGLNLVGREHINHNGHVVTADHEVDYGDWVLDEVGGGENLTLREGARERMSGDCRDFCEHHADLLERYASERSYDPSQGTVWSYAGHDFWLTRQGHGAGFWDRGLGELGAALTEAAKAYGSADDHTPYDCGDGTADA